MPQRNKKARKGSGQPKGTKRVDPDRVDPKLVDIDYGRLRGVTASIELDAITLVRSHFASAANPRVFDEDNGQSEYSLGITDARWFVEPGRLELLLEYSVRAIHRRASGEHVDLFDAVSAFVAAYALPADFVADDEVMADFVLANGQINVFPYVRHQMADQSSKAGWRTLVLKVLRVPARRPVGLVKHLPPWVRLDE